MKRKILLLIAPLMIFASVGLAMSQKLLAFDPFQGTCSDQGQQSPGCNHTSTDPVSGKDGIITKAVQILAILTGVAAVIVIIIGGFNFVTSGGDPQKVSTAKNTILYAVIGLIVAVLAQAVVVLVLSKL